MPTNQYRGEIVVPTTHDKAEDVIEFIKDVLCDEFGGYSAYRGSGGWVADDGEMFEEEHVRLVASGSSSEGHVTETFRKCAETLKNVCDEQAVLVEVYETKTLLV
jgi:hypothetical protein